MRSQFVTWNPKCFGFFFGESKHKIFWKAGGIAFHSLVERFGRNAVDLRKIPIQHHTRASDRVDHRVDLLDCGKGFGFLRHGRERLSKNSSDEKEEAE